MRYATALLISIWLSWNLGWARLQIQPADPSQNALAASTPDNVGPSDIVGCAGHARGSR
jgi:hypothetical protein